MSKGEKYRCLGCLRRDKIIEQLRSELEAERIVNRCGWEEAERLKAELKNLQPDNILDFKNSVN